MKRLWRLLYYARRYWLQALSAVVLAAGVGMLDAFRVLLIGPIFDNVLQPGRSDRAREADHAAGRDGQALAHHRDAAGAGPALDSQ